MKRYGSTACIDSEGGARINLLTSRENPLYKLYKAVKSRKGRRKHRLFLVEGPHLVEEAVNSSFPIHSVMVEGEEPRRELLPVLRRLEARNIPVSHITGSLFCRLAETETPQGILALAALPGQEEPLPAPDKFLGLLLNGIRDPGNIGVILRTAWAAGVKDIFITPGTADPYSGKAVRSSQGGLFHLRLHYHPLSAFLDWAQKNTVATWVGDPRGERIYYEENFCDPVLFILGHETRGPEKAAREAGRSIKIPLAAAADSLNVAVSAGILLYEALRQRAAWRRTPGRRGERE